MFGGLLRKNSHKSSKYKHEKERPRSSKDKDTTTREEPSLDRRHRSNRSSDDSSIAGARPEDKRHNRRSLPPGTTLADLYQSTAGEPLPPLDALYDQQKRLAELGSDNPWSGETPTTSAAKSSASSSRPRDERPDSKRHGSSGASVFESCRRSRRDDYDNKSSESRGPSRSHTSRGNSQGETGSTQSDENVYTVIAAAHRALADAKKSSSSIVVTVSSVAPSISEPVLTAEPEAETLASSPPPQVIETVTSGNFEATEDTAAVEIETGVPAQDKRAKSPDLEALAEAIRAKNVEEEEAAPADTATEGAVDEPRETEVPPAEDLAGEPVTDAADTAEDDLKVEDPVDGAEVTKTVDHLEEAPSEAGSAITVVLTTESPEMGTEAEDPSVEVPDAQTTETPTDTNKVEIAPFQASNNFLSLPLEEMGISFDTSTKLGDRSIGVLSALKASSRAPKNRFAVLYNTHMDNTEGGDTGKANTVFASLISGGKLNGMLYSDFNIGVLLPPQDPIDKATTKDGEAELVYIGHVWDDADLKTTQGAPTLLPVDLEDRIKVVSGTLLSLIETEEGSQQWRKFDQSMASPPRTAEVMSALQSAKPLLTFLAGRTSEAVETMSSAMRSENKQVNDVKSGWWSEHGLKDAPKGYDVDDWYDWVDAAILGQSQKETVEVPSEVEGPVAEATEIGGLKGEMSR